MSEVIETTQSPESAPEATEAPTATDEKALLLQRAKMMGIRHSPNIGVDALKAKIAAHMANEAPPQEEEPEAPEAPPEMKANAPATRPLSKQELRQKLIKEATKLVRIRVTCLDPKKKDLPGEIFTVANSYVGTIRKFVPFGEPTENGYHVPHCIYEFMKSRKFLHIRTVKSPTRGERVEANYVSEFAIEVLPPLTKDELQRLAMEQAARAGT